MRSSMSHSNLRSVGEAGENALVDAHHGKRYKLVEKVTSDKKFENDGGWGKNDREVATH